jgi:DNA (cytosine-5)-methyltransferase 1
MSTNKSLNSISIFTGIGGLDFGCEAAGFNTRVALDNNLDAYQFIKNNRKWPFINKDIHQVSGEQILSLASLNAGEVQLLTAGAPCQPFSKSGYWHNGETLRLSDERSNTIAKFLEVLKDTKPLAFVFENVPALIYNNKDEALNFILDSIKRINSEEKTNYIPKYKVLNAVGYGVPQSRERFFIVASREGIPFKFPNYTHQLPTENDNVEGKLPYLNAWDAFSDLNENDENDELKIGGKWADLLPSIPEGKNYLWHTSRGGGEPFFGWRTRYWNFLLKLSKQKASWTIQSQPGSSTGPFHWDNRRLSIKEMSRIQTLPDNLHFDMNLNKAQILIGNAVPSLLAEVLAREIRSQFFNDFDLDQPLQFLRKKSLSYPDPESPQIVPKKYYFLNGKHDDHPGKGKGPGALLFTKSN